LEKRAVLLCEQNPMTYSTPARLYQLRSKITTPRRGEVLHVALHVHLRLLAVRRRRQRDDAKHARAHALGDRADRAALAAAVATLKDDDDAQPVCFTSIQQPAQLRPAACDESFPSRNCLVFQPSLLRWCRCLWA
jgi:hypothetical protein